jgi:hypothetical protein
MRNPAGQALFPIDDRNWMEFFGGDTVYLAYRDFTGLQATSKFWVNQSLDGGFSYGPAVLAALCGNTTGDISVDQRDGTVYFCFQGPDTAGNKQVLIAVGHPPTPGIAPTAANYTTYVAATGRTATIAALFPACKVAPDGTVYVTYSDGGTGIYIAHSLDQGKTWAPPVRVSNLQSPSSALFPWITTGNLPGAVAVSWYGVEAGDSDDGLGANNDQANWKVFVAESINATAQNPTFYQAVASDHYIHGSNISLGGFGGTANRNLGDFFQLSTDPQGLVFVAYDDDSNDFYGNGYVTHQVGGLSLNTGKTLTVPGRDPAPAFNPAAPQVKDERHDARVFTGAIPIVPDVDSPVDILTIQYGCDVRTAGKTLITAVMRLSGLITVPPEGVWRMSFASNPTRPGVSDHADQWYLEADTDATGNQTFVYGKATRGSDGFMVYTAAGPADSGAFNTAAGTVSVSVDASKLNLLQTHGAIRNGTTFIGLRGSASVARASIAGLVGVAVQDSTRGGTHYLLNLNACAGSTSAGDQDDGQGEDSDRSDRDEFTFHDSQSNPGSSDLQYNDHSRNMAVQSVGGVSSITYNGACVSFLGNALVNLQPGYQFTFSACDLSAAGTGIGTFTIAITGPPGFIYQKSAALTSGYVHIHPH